MLGQPMRITLRGPPRASEKRHDRFRIWSWRRQLLGVAKSVNPDPTPFPDGMKGIILMGQVKGTDAEMQKYADTKAREIQNYALKKTDIHVLYMYSTPVSRLSEGNSPLVHDEAGCIYDFLSL
ncbi:hypothetical protein RRG08_008909 [Elysia crispata]|uniref:Uncharacterized protein n=1 Tax=Elysia crispata TaxID=231223 RepID=A0AAE1DNP9_9GAST|nr:hypothetical protein RRG08_008909 [Elysia crispata]